MSRCCLRALALVASPFVVAAQTRPAPSVSSVDIAQSRRPTPGAVYERPGFTRAVTNGTRTRTGQPGARNWVQHARYTIDATIDPTTSTLRGTEHVVYRNASPDTLRELAIHLRQNAFKPESQRRDAATLTTGLALSRVDVNGAAIAERTEAAVRRGRATNSGATAGYAINGTVMRLLLPSPLMPHDSVALDLAWSYVPPITPGDGRQGRDDRLYIMGYWYPQIAVYDDVDGWVADQYLLEAEFYMDPADYDVRITIPRGWVVGASGSLVNADAILSNAARERLALARRTRDVVTVSRPDDGNAAFATSAPNVTWHFLAPNVRDFAWGTSDRYVWDATNALITNASGARDTVDIFSFYRVNAPAAAWALGGARYTRDAIEQLSSYLWTYPWPTMTSMEGVLTSGGMEYPRLTAMQPWADTLSLAGDLMHETGHMWFPMQVGSNETRHPWMDEGLTQFDAAQGMRQLYGEPRVGGRPNDQEPGQRRTYLQRASIGQDQILMTTGDLFPAELYNTMYYNKTGQVLSALRSVLGEPTFHRALREYGHRWIDRHPSPEDFFNTFDDVAKRDLSWFWRTWFYEPWSLDQAIASVRPGARGTDITIEDRGLAPMPVTLAVTRTGGRIDRIEIPVDVWLGGARTYVVHVPRVPAVTRVEIDPDGAFPDVDRTNQVWTKRQWAGGTRMAHPPLGSPPRPPR